MLLLLFNHSVVSDSATPWTAACQASLSFTISRSLFKLTFTESLMPSSHLILCRPRLLLLSIFPSIRIFQMSQVFTSGGQSIRVSASASMNIEDWFPSGWTGWISLLSKGLLRVFSNTTQSSKATNFWCSAFFILQLSHPYMTTGKTIALTRRTFVGKVMSLLLNILSRLVIAFLPRRKRLLISWLHSSSAVILEPKEINKKKKLPSRLTELKAKINNWV